MMTTKPKWTVLVYMVADSGDGFYQDAMDDIAEMMRARFDDQIKIVVYADAPSPWLAKCWEFTGPSRINGEMASEKKIGETSGLVCRRASLLDFVQERAKPDKSDNYLLVLWGHGEGIDWKQKVFAGQPPSSTIEGAGKRFAPGSQGAIEVGELGKALAGLKLGIDRRHIVVGFDACLMGMVEVFDEIHPYVGWVVAADDEIPDTGWPYTPILQWLGANPETQPEALATQIVNLCAESYSDPDQYPQYLESKVSFVSCDLSKSPAVLEAMKNLTSELSTHIKDPLVRKAVKDARDFAEDFREKAYVDLYAFCSALIRLTQPKAELQRLRGVANSVMNALSDPEASGFVTGFRFSDSYPYRYVKDARAVSICFPESNELLGSISDLRVNWRTYKKLTFCESTYWPDFLERFWGTQPLGKAVGQG
jgi:hypothetical protein